MTTGKLVIYFYSLGDGYNKHHISTIYMIPVVPRNPVNFCKSDVER